jgi:hypothetical protein
MVPPPSADQITAHSLAMPAKKRHHGVEFTPERHA